MVRGDHAFKSFHYLIRVPSGAKEKPDKQSDNWIDARVSLHKLTPIYR